MRHNRGYYVAEIGLKEAEELYDIREALETIAVQKVIRHFNPDSLKLLKQAMEAYSTDVHKGMLSRKRLILDADFHLKLAEITGSKSLVDILRMIFSKIYLKHKTENLPSQRSKMADHEHKEIFEAICSKDLSGALKKIRKHIALGRKNILGSLVEEKRFG